MRSQFSLRFFLPVCLFAFAACAGTIDQRVDPDAPDAVGGTGLQSQDIRTMADTMARDLGEAGILTSASDGKTVTFYIMAMENQSSDTINKEIIVSGIETALLKKYGQRIVVLDRSSLGLDAVRRERDAKRAGAVSANQGQKGDVMGADYVLYGVIRDRTQQSGSLKSAFYQVTFTLTDLETDRKIWQNDYQTKFLSEKSVINR